MIFKYILLYEGGQMQWHPVSTQRTTLIHTWNWPADIEKIVGDRVRSGQRLPRPKIVGDRVSGQRLPPQM